MSCQISSFLYKNPINTFRCFYYAKIHKGYDSQLPKRPSVSVCRDRSPTLSNNKSQENLLLLLLRWTLPSAHYTLTSCLNLYSLSICWLKKPFTWSSSTLQCARYGSQMDEIKLFGLRIKKWSSLRMPRWEGFLSVTFPTAGISLTKKKEAIHSCYSGVYRNAGTT